VASDISVILMTAQGRECHHHDERGRDGAVPAEALRILDGAAAGDLLVLQGNLSAATTAALLTEARGRGMATALNPSPVRDFLAGLWALVDTAFVNEGEAAAFGGVARMRAEGAWRVVLTLGSAGARLVRPEGEATVAAAPAHVVDTTGAGDCFMAAALASAALRGVQIDARALSHGARAAALTVSRAGTMRAFPTAAEMAAILAT
jgi:ribokinase